MGNASLEFRAGVTNWGIISLEVLLKAGENRSPRAGVTIERRSRKSSQGKRQPRRSQKKTAQQRGGDRL